MKRWAPLTGAAFSLLLVAAFIVGGSSPGGKDSAQKVVSYYTNHDSKQIVAALLVAYATLFFLFFLGVWRAELRRTEGPAGGLSAVVLASGVLFAVGGMIFASLTFTLADLADNLDPSAAQALNALNDDFFLPLAVGGGAFMIASGIASVKGGALPRWLGWAAVVIGVVSVTPIGFVGFLVTVAWVLVVSIVLATREPAGPAAETPPAPGPAAGP